MDLMQLLLAILVGGGIAVAIAYQQRRMRATAALFRALAMRHGGRVVDGTWLSWPMLELHHQGRTTTVRPVSGGRNRPDRTRVAIDTGLPAALRLVVQVRGPFAKLTRVWGLEQIEVGNAAFDRAFVIQGEPAGLARARLSAAVQAQLQHLRKRNPRLALTNGRLTLTVDRIPRDAAGFEELITGAAILSDAAPVAMPDGHWRDDRPAPTGHAIRRRHRGTEAPFSGKAPVAMAMAMGAALLVTAACVIWLSGHAPSASNPRTIDPTLGDLTDHSYSGYRGRVIGINGDGVALHLDDFAGAFLWVDMEGPWCSTSATQAQTIRSLTGSRTDVAFLTLVTSDQEPLSTPDQASARRWASVHGLSSKRVVAYGSTMTVPHHILYSPTGQTLLRHTGYLPAEQLQAMLTDQLHRWHTLANAE
jgi:hypothetical protein